MGPVIVLVVAAAMVALVAILTAAAGAIVEHGPYAFLICVAGGAFLVTVGVTRRAMVRAVLKDLREKAFVIMRECGAQGLTPEQRDALRDEWRKAMDGIEQARIDLLWCSIVIWIGLFVLVYSVAVGVWGLRTLA